MSTRIQHERGFTTGRGPVVTHQGTTYGALSWSVRPRGSNMLMDCLVAERRLAKEWDGEWTDQEMADMISQEFGISITAAGINYHTKKVKPEEWDLHANVRAVPLLSALQREARVVHAEARLA